jgi:hypothetical protein
LFSAQNGKIIRRIAAHGDIVALSPDGRTLAYADRTSLWLLKMTADYRPASPPAIVAREPRDIFAIKLDA